MVAQWLLPVLWREHDWRSALDRLGTQLATAPANSASARAACELGRASEYIEPDRRRAIAAYELAGAGNDGGRALELATELGWWSARARLIAAARARSDDPRLALDEAEAWWDAGQPDLCALALAGARGERDERADDLAALVAERDLADRAAEAVARAVSVTTALDAADTYVMAARFSRAAGRRDDMTRWLEEALTADPGHATAASFLLALARQNRDPDPLQKVLKLRVASAAPSSWVDRTRAAAFSLLDSEHHRGFGLRLLREALERSYQSHHADIPGHLAIWTVLAAHAAAGGHRRELLPLVLDALQVTKGEVDRVWLGALATEITLRDANNPVVAGAYAEIVAEHAPEHPMLRELVTAVATAEPDPTPEDPPASQQVPAAAKSAAATQLEEAAFDIDLDDAYAEAAEAMIDDSEIEEIVDEPAVSTSNSPAPSKSLPSKPVTAPAPVKPAEPKPIPTVAKAAPAPAKPTASPTPSAATEGRAKVRARIPTAASFDVTDADAPQIAPASVVKPSTPAKIASIVPVSVQNASSILPTSMRPSIKPAPKPEPAKPAPAKPEPAKPAPAKLAPLPADKPLPKAMPPVAAKPLPKATPKPESAAAPVLAALRTPASPVLPPPVEMPRNAQERARRIAIPIDVRLVPTSGKRIAATSADISTTGLFVLTADTSLAVGDTLTIELMLPGEEAFTEEEFRSNARIARRADDGYGIELVDPDAKLLAALSAL